MSKRFFSMMIKEGHEGEEDKSAIESLIKDRGIVVWHDIPVAENNLRQGDYLIVRVKGKTLCLLQVLSDMAEDFVADTQWQFFGWASRARRVEVISWYDTDRKHLNLPEMSWLGHLKTCQQVLATEQLEKLENWLMQVMRSRMENNVAEVLQKSWNVILTGAPGTGKTYLARQIAQHLILSSVRNNDERSGCTNEVLFKEQLGFCQFHPSMDYTDFVEGLRPCNVDEETGQIGFELRDGIFKEFCRRALKGCVSDVPKSGRVDNFDNAWKNLIAKINAIDEGILSIPMTEGRHLDVEVNTLGTGLASRKYDESGMPIKGQNKFFSSEQLYRVYRGKNGVPSGAHDGYRKHILKFMKSDCGLQDFVEGISDEQMAVTVQPYVFIIDEINRGDIAKIFGELFFSIDPGYRGREGEIQTQYCNLIAEDDDFKKFFVPRNVYIIGTMNDIDRGVESMDFAIRRRFTWLEIKPEDTQAAILESHIADPALRERAKNRMDNLNIAIKKDPDLGAAFQIGAAYFARLQEDDFDTLWKHHLCPLLREYMRGQENIANREADFKKAFENENKIASTETAQP